MMRVYDLAHIPGRGGAVVNDTGHAARLEALCLQLRDFLRSAKKSIEAEIHTYPTPSPRCDAQYNHLYEQRARLAHLLGRIDAMPNREGAEGHTADTLAEFAASAPLTEAAEEKTLRGRIGAEISSLG